MISHHLFGTTRTIHPQHEAVVWQLRAPRVALGALVGGALGLAGATYQSVFRNPLADPYLLGSAAGAGLGATIALAVLHQPELAPPFAFFGALFAVASAWFIGDRVGGGSDTAIILLAGIAVMSFLTAIQTLVLQRHHDSLNAVYSWILGRVATSGWQDVVRLFPYVLFASVVLILLSRRIELLSLGDDKARTLGVSVSTTRIIAILAATLATAGAVSLSGLVGFVGLVIPHIARRIVGPSPRVLFVASLLIGGVFVVIADLVARTIVAPAELPIGVITAFVGAPFFVGVLISTQRRVS